MYKLIGVRVSTRVAMFATIVTLWGLAMVSCTNSNSPTAPEEGAGGGLEATVTTAKADKSDKAPLCHYQEEMGTWKLLVLPSEAAGSHFANHDDAVPGGTSAITGTALDDECQPAAATCPCFDADYLIALFDPGEPYRPLSAGYSSAASFFHDNCGSFATGNPLCKDKYQGDSWLAEVYYRYDSATDTEVPNCYVVNKSTSTTVIRTDISQLQFDACRAEVGAARPFLLENPQP